MRGCDYVYPEIVAGPNQESIVGDSRPLSFPARREVLKCLQEHGLFAKIDKAAAERSWI